MAMFYDTHTIYFICKDTTFAKLIDNISDVLAKANIITNYMVCIINRNEDPDAQYGFIYVVNPQAYHCLLGYNPDGSIQDESNYVDTAVDEKMTWYDITLAEEARIFNIQNKIIRSPLLNNDIMEVKSAVGVPPMLNFYDNILKSGTVPKWVNKDIVKNNLSILFTNDTPIIEIRTYKTHKIIYLIFKSNACFILHMIKRSKLSNGNKEASIRFNFANKNEYINKN